MSSKPDSAKKQIFQVIIAFIIGILAARYFFDKKTQAKHNIEIAEEVEKKVINEFAQEQPLISKKTPQITASENQFKAAPQIVPNQTSKVIHQAEIPKPRRIELTLDEETVGNLERNINDLFVKVTMRREDHGWRVNYMTSDNLMASTGIQNNDLVLFELIETAKADPINRSLVTRLENVFSTLER
jgi:hypothetical protein